MAIAESHFFVGFSPFPALNYCFSEKPDFGNCQKSTAKVTTAKFGFPETEEREIRRMKGLKGVQDVKGVMGIIGVKEVNEVRAVKEMNGVKVATGSPKSRKSTGRRGNGGKLRECRR